MFQKYFNPLKRPEHAQIIEPALLEEILYQIPELLDIHKNLLEIMTARVDDWGDNQIIGDIFINQVCNICLSLKEDSFVSSIS